MDKSGFAFRRNNTRSGFSGQPKFEPPSLEFDGRTCQRFPEIVNRHTFVTFPSESSQRDKA
jgi:hypothetical protein